MTLLSSAPIVFLFGTGDKISPFLLTILELNPGFIFTIDKTCHAD